LRHRFVEARVALAAFELLRHQARTLSGEREADRLGGLVP
jgi:hypothetical protein